jgi:hypothetical protein
LTAKIVSAVPAICCKLMVVGRSVAVCMVVEQNVHGQFWPPLLSGRFLQMNLGVFWRILFLYRMITLLAATCKYPTCVAAIRFYSATARNKRKIFNSGIVHGDGSRSSCLYIRTGASAPIFRAFSSPSSTIYTPGVFFLFFNVFFIHRFLSFNQPILLSITKWFPQSSVLPSSSTVRFLRSLPD